MTLVCGGQLGPYLTARGQRSVATVLADLGVEVLEADVVAEVRSDAVVLGDGTVRPSALTIWTAGFGVPDLATRSGLRTDGAGRLLTDETLTSVDDPRVVAGDCASPSGVPLRMSCQAAGPLGAAAAATVLSRIEGSAPAPLDQAFFGACISLGRRSGILQPSHLDDQAAGPSITGRLIAPVKEAVCRSTLWSLRREAHKPGSAIWFGGGRRTRRTRAERVARAQEDERSRAEAAAATAGPATTRPVP